MNINQISIAVFPDGRMDTRNTAIYLGVSEKTLAMWRCSGNTPQFIKRGNRIFYFKSDLDNWNSQKYKSTAQARLKESNND